MGLPVSKNHTFLGLPVSKNIIFWDSPYLKITLFGTPRMILCKNQSCRRILETLQFSHEYSIKLEADFYIFYIKFIYLSPLAVHEENINSGGISSKTCLWPLTHTECQLWEQMLKQIFLHFFLWPVQMSIKKILRPFFLNMTGSTSFIMY